MKITLWTLFILAFIWIISVLVAFANPAALFGSVVVIVATTGAIIALGIALIFR